MAVRRVRAGPLRRGDVTAARATRTRAADLERREARGGDGDVRDRVGEQERERALERAELARQPRARWEPLRDVREERAEVRGAAEVDEAERAGRHELAGLGVGEEGTVV